MEAALRGEELGELDDLVGDERVALLALGGLLEDDELLDQVEQRRRRAWLGSGSGFPTPTCKPLAPLASRLPPPTPTP